MLIFCIAVLFIYSSVYSQEIKIIDGIKTINNEKPVFDKNPQIKLEYVRKYGGLDETRKEFILFNPNSIAIDSYENIYILNVGDNKIKKFNKNGEYVSEFSGKGQGPSEFVAPMNLDISKDNKLYVIDSDFMKILVLNTNGRELKRIPISKPGQWPPPFLLTSSNEFILWTIKFSTGGYIKLTKGETDEYVIRNIQIVDSTGKFIKEFPVKERKAKPEDFHFKYSGDTFSYSLDSKDNIIVALLYQNRIEIYSLDGNLLLRITRNLGFNESKKAESIHQFEGTIYHGVKSLVNRFSISVSIDDKDRIWVLSFRRVLSKEEILEKTPLSIEPVPEATQIEVYDKNGIWLEKIIPEQCDYSIGSSGGLFIKAFKNRLFIIDYYYENAVYEYKIVEKQ
jgi:hypothetical protein